ncbi:Indole-3-acetaldehyde oxidase [Acorus gramineus]|uniref:Indole-3-acetaldehyde oxidase n=1 Tax=Acorus gramineus TaxID=55184 RepID=A0AAV9B764_ACOGR|nr:Indole-3-acetaldehyde oxidase [Acorus gramineus]
MEENTKRKLVFAINGRRFKLSKVDPSTTLLEFLRSETPFRGAKLGCGEGGCGACVVLLSKYDPSNDKVEGHAVSSCLTLLCSINLCSITTTEGLGSQRDGFHSIHQRFSGFHASQCGFCTPGMCMSLFSALVNAAESERPDPPSGFSKITASEAEESVAGNICRCTGYRPILDACKSFAADIDLEDLGLNSFWKKGDKGGSNVDKLPRYRPEGVCTFPEFLKAEIKSSLVDSTVGRVAQLDIANKSDLSSSLEHSWHLPVSVKGLYGLLKEFEGRRIKWVVGNTASGVYKDYDQYEKYIDLRCIPELSMIRKDDKGIEVGAAVTISKAIEVLREEKSVVFTKLAEHMKKVASQFIRNTASLGGNLILAQRDRFPSDIATILLAVDSSVCIYNGSETIWTTLEEFLTRPKLDFGTLLLSVRIPNSFQSTEMNLVFKTYRASPRPLGNALSHLNAAFLAEIFDHNKSEGVVLKNLRLAFGAYGNDHAIRAKKVEEFLDGKSVTASVFLEAVRLLRVTIVPREGTSHPSYRCSLAVGFLFDYIRPFCEQLQEPPRNIGNPNCNFNKYDVASSCKSNKIENVGELEHSKEGVSLLSAKQVIKFSKEYHPVGDPIQKAGAEIQASGEAVYVDDIPSPSGCLHGAFICSTVPLAHIKGIEIKSSFASQKIVSLVSARDIPKGGTNIGSQSMFGTELLFADDLTEFAGQPLGLVIAETQRFANMVANRAVVNYETEAIESPILTVEDAVRRSSFFEVPSFLFPKQVGDFSKGMAEADHKIVSEIKLGSQYYFYMETQTALAIPDEDDCMVVYSSSQCPENVQIVIARCLGIPQNNVRVITRRVGGGFGGKALRSIPVSTACALAAYKLRRPVRVYLDRKTDMIMAGGRHPMKVNYSVGFKSDGKITALHIDLLINAGISEDVSPIMPHNIIGALKKYDWGALSFDIKVCKTNLPSKSAMRGPGEVQGSFIADAILEHVASFLFVNADIVKEKNLHTYESLRLFYEGNAGEPVEYTLPSIFDKLASSSSFVHRVEMIKQFNIINKWRKRGISRVPIVHQVTLRPTPGKVSVLSDGSIVVEVGGIELGQGLWTKVKQMTAFALGRLWSDGSHNLLEKVRVIQADTLSLIQGGFTAGSTTSESSCEAVRLSCNVLVERLLPLKKRLEEQMGSVSWDTLIQQASLEAVNLSSSTHWAPEFSSMNYLNYGVAASEVEIDLLTGATEFLRTDIIYDCGQSLNPAVDLGQIEGAFVQGIGFFIHEEYLSNSEGLVVSDGTWNYKVPTVDTIPRQFNVEVLNSGHHKERVLSSKASGEPPLLLASSIHCAMREAIREARKEFASYGGFKGSSPTPFHLEVPATMPVVKELCGLDNVEKYLESLISSHSTGNGY